MGDAFTALPKLPAMYLFGMEQHQIRIVVLEISMYEDFSETNFSVDRVQNKPQVYKTVSACYNRVVF